MTEYIIIYSVLLAAFAVAAITCCLLYVRSRLRKIARIEERTLSEAEGEKAILEIFGNENMPACVLIDAETLQPLFISANVSAFLGVTPEELFTDTACYKKNIDKQFTRTFSMNFKEWDRASILEQEFAHGEDKYAKVETFEVEYADKKYIAFAFYDITEQRNAQIDMQRKLDSALEQASAKSMFLSNMSHEIRTPMNGVMGMMSLARMNINDPEKVLNYLDRAGDLSVFLLGMINDILDISKIESGKMQLFNSDMDVFGFAEKIRNMFTGTITGKGIAFNVETVDFTARYFVCDEMRLTQVVTNLVSNASKFTPAGGRIDVTFKQLGHIGEHVQLLIRIRDTGKGIAPENIRKIMRPFEQEEASTAHNYGGTGLGLAICDNIVRLMGGNIVIDSTLGKGTDFSVFLSLAVSDVEQDMTKPVEQEQAHEEEAAEFEYDGCRILLAEDNEVNAEIAIEILESEGAVVTLAHDGKEAVDIFVGQPANSFDLLLLDIQMPRLDGRSAAKEIRKSGKADAISVPIIALSAEAFLEDVKLSEAAGMDGHVSKPVDFDVLRKRAGEIIAAKKKKGRK